MFLVGCLVFVAVAILLNLATGTMGKPDWRQWQEEGRAHSHHRSNR
ncbi:hypothetical protein [Rheinheimera hassiensis]|nr:hypothetical protein [Rheinheimera hassiensis]